MRIPSEARLKDIYGTHLAEAKERYTHLIQMFEERFPGQEALFFTAPGRTEIIGNHTDHNGGKILAASVDMDTICAAQKTDDRIVTIVSEGYVPVTIDLDKLDEIPTCEGTLSLTAGILEGMVRRGFRAGGFNAFVTTQVVSAAGVSSSASYEMMIGTVVNTLFNDGKMETADIARIGRYAENVWWEKASGLMDQMACGFGGCVLLDFDDSRGQGSVSCERVNFSFEDIGMDI
ncbi:MAG: galactokinase, partial [Butyrivibrio sp.]|nr:galactokinase [Butyrivibrio sp.]